MKATGIYDGPEGFYGIFNPPMNNLKYSHGYYLGIQSIITGLSIDDAYLSCDNGKTKLHIVPYGQIFKFHETNNFKINKSPFNENEWSTYNSNKCNIRNTIAFLDLGEFSLLFADIGKDKKEVPYNYFLINGFHEECFPDKFNINFDMVNEQLAGCKRYSRNEYGIQRNFFELTGKLLKVFDGNDEEVKNAILTEQSSPDHNASANKYRPYVYFKHENVSIRPYDANGNPLPYAVIVLLKPRLNICTIL